MTAHWIILDKHHYKCSNCGGVVQTNYSPGQWQHCPFCLAEMTEEPTNGNSEAESNS